MPPTHWIRSWNGFETKRDELESLCKAAVEADALAARECDKMGISAIGAICLSCRDQNAENPSKYAKQTAELMNKIGLIEYDLVWNHWMDCNFVVNFSRSILNPNSSPIKLSRKNKIPADIEDRKKWVVVYGSDEHRRIRSQMSN